MSKYGLLLDTHVWIWLNEGIELKPEVVKLIEKEAKETGIFIGAISIWELATLVQKKRLILKMPIEKWVEEALSKPGISLVPLSPLIAVESTKLPNEVHGDPADRILIATARIKQLTLITRDRKIIEYSNAGYVNVKEA